MDADVGRRGEDLRIRGVVEANRQRQVGWRGICNDIDTHHRSAQASAKKRLQQQRRTALAKALQKRYGGDGLAAEFRAFGDVEALRKA